MSREQERGFTLVELMIVVAIVGILTAVALPVYRSYVVRTKMSEVVLAASACRTRISEVYQAGVSPAPTAGAWGCEIASPATRYVKNVSTDGNGNILAIATGFGDASIDDKVLTLTPLVDGNAAKVATDFGKAINGWRCGSVGDGTTVPQQHLPATCQGL